MKKVLNPFFILVFAALPYTVLCIIASSGVETLLEALSAAAAVAFFVKIRKDEHIAKKYLLLMIIAAVLQSVAIKVVTRDEPTLVYALFSFIPALYAVLSLAYHTTVQREHTQQKQNLLQYVAGVIFLPFTIFIIVIITSGLNLQGLGLVILIFGVFLTIYLLAYIFFNTYGSIKDNTTPDLNTKMSRKTLIISALLGIILPIFGLTLNTMLMELNGGVFGDFSSPIFFLVAAFNGVLLVLPHSKEPGIRLLMFYFKSVGYAYVLYFFVAFLPYIPLGVIGLIIILGILLFAPAALMIWQGKIMLGEVKILKQRFNKLVIGLVFIGGLLTLPIYGYLSISSDAANLQAAAEYLTNANANKTVNISKLNRSIMFIKSDYSMSLNRMNGLLGGINTNFTKGKIPLLTSLYKSLTVGNKTIGLENIEMLDKIFNDYQFDESSLNFSSTDSTWDSSVRISKVTSESSYDKQAGAYRTWINIELQNNGISNTEYSTQFSLPEGAYVSNYYLDVFDKRKYGMLTDRRAALFIYNSIVASQRDPGILHYVGNNELELRVFPFQSDELRKTGFEILHQKPFNLDIDSESIVVGKGIDPTDGFSEIDVGCAMLLSSEFIERLSTIDRQPEYNFVIDCSANSDVEYQKQKVLDYCNLKKISDANVYFVSYKPEKTTLNNMNKFKYKKLGGFNLNIALGMILTETDSPRYPIIIAVSDNMSGAVFPKADFLFNMKALSDRYPESRYYYALQNSLSITPYSFINNMRGETMSEPLTFDAKDYNGNAVANDGNDKLVIKDINAKIDGIFPHGEGSLYKNAVLLNAYSKMPNLSSKTEYIKDSFRAGILTPKTAFIVVETLEQEDALLSLQEKILSDNYDLAENLNQPVNLTEPSIWILMVCAVVVMLINKRRINS